MEPLFERVQGMLEGARPGEALEHLIAVFRERREHALLFEARLMQRRMELGLPLIQVEGSEKWPAEQQKAYEETVVEVAREVGGLFLADGAIARAFPYFRAIGEVGVVKEALERYELRGEEEVDGVIDVAFQQGVHPAKGLEFILDRYGMCRAITIFGMYGAANSRDACVDLLVERLYGELAENLGAAVERREGARPETGRVSELMAGREWLFGEFDYYVDTSHLSSVIQYSPDAVKRETWEKVREMCEYGSRLSENFRIYGNPPYEDVYVDHGTLANCMLGERVEEGLAHFRGKVEASEEGETLAAQALVQLLLRLGRVKEAMEVAVERLKEKQAQEITCPTAMQLCRMAGEYGVLQELARGRGDVLSYVAAGLEKETGHGG